MYTIQHINSGSKVRTVRDANSLVKPNVDKRRLRGWQSATSFGGQEIVPEEFGTISAEEFNKPGYLDIP